MDLKTLRAELQKLAALAEGWDASHEIADIERDMALGKLRELYDAVRFGLDSAVQPSVEDELSPVDLPPMEIDLDAVIPLTAMSEPFGADPAAAPLEEPTIAPPVVESPVACKEYKMRIPYIARTTRIKVNTNKNAIEK